MPKLLKPERISLGVIPGDEVREFELAGSSELIHSLKITSFEGFPVDSTVELRLGTDVAHIVIRIGDSLKSGLVKGIIHLKSQLGGDFSIDVFGLMGPKN